MMLLHTPFCAIIVTETETEHADIIFVAFQHENENPPELNLTSVHLLT